jgi:hypothetical protein
MVPSSAPTVLEQRVSWGVLTALGVAVAAMAALHVVEPGLDPLQEPVSFYVWGRHGWLLPLALAAFGVALFGLARVPAGSRSVWPRRMIRLSGGALLVAAIVPSDCWFPWEDAPTVSGVVHAVAAMVAPALLLGPMRAWPFRRVAGLRPWIVAGYFAALVASAGSLALGFWQDRSPSWIGLYERILACAAVAWVAGVAWPTRAND